MKKVCTLTDFYVADPSYSLCIVIEEQLGMLLRHGYKPVAIVEDIFEPVRVWKDVELRHIPHGIQRSNNVKFYPNWDDGVKKYYEAIKEALHDIDVVISHDLIYQSATLWHNYAARKVASEMPHVLWLNWIHSASPSMVWTQSDNRLMPVQRHFPNSFTVYPNSWSAPRVAQNFKCELKDVAFVPHSTDVYKFWGFQDKTVEFSEKFKLLDADAVLVYPVRLDRGKQAEYVIRTGAALKRLGKQVRVIVVDFHSTGGDKVEYRKWLKQQGIDFGLNEIELAFTSEFCEEWQGSVPREVVRDLMLLCNIFVQPSKSETYSLIAQEAGLCGALLILNFDFPPMRDIYGRHALYYKFSSNIDVMSGLDGDTNTEYHNIDDYFMDIGRKCLWELNHNHVLAQQRRIIKERNPDYVFRNFIEPLFHARDGEE